MALNVNISNIISLLKTTGKTSLNVHSPPSTAQVKKNLSQTELQI